jgi:hypothetical protein
LRTFMTIFCSSMRKARTIFSRTALWLKTPEMFRKYLAACFR